MLTLIAGIGVFDLLCTTIFANLLRKEKRNQNA